jgi:hypothetical protein
MATHQVVHVDYGFHGSDVYKATIDRGLSASGPWTPIGETFLTGNEGYFYDNTMPFDTPVWYRFHSFSITEVAGPDYVDGPFTLVSNGSVVLSDPLRPWADIEFGHRLRHLVRGQRRVPHLCRHDDCRRDLGRSGHGCHGLPVRRIVLPTSQTYRTVLPTTTGSSRRGQRLRPRPWPRSGR